MQDTRTPYRLAAFLALFCIVLMGLAFGAPENLKLLQPSLPDANNIDFFRASLERPRSVLLFMAIDTLFVFAYLTLFVGLYRETRQGDAVLALLALASGIAAAGCDLLENSYLTSYALQGLYDHPLGSPALPLIYVLGSMKWLTAFFTAFLFGLLWRGDSLFHRALALSMLAFPLLGALTIAVPEWLVIRPLPLVISTVLLAWYWTRPLSD